VCSPAIGGTKRCGWAAHDGCREGRASFGTRPQPPRSHPRQCGAQSFEVSSPAFWPHELCQPGHVGGLLCIGHMAYWPGERPHSGALTQHTRLHLALAHVEQQRRSRTHGITLDADRPHARCGLEQKAHLSTTRLLTIRARQRFDDRVGLALLSSCSIPPPHTAHPTPARGCAVARKVLARAQRIDTAELPSAGQSPVGWRGASGEQ